MRLLSNAEMIELGWKYYLSINKHFSTLERDAYIEATGEKIVNEAGREEKLWRCV